MLVLHILRSLSTLDHCQCPKSVPRSRNLVFRSRSEGKRLPPCAVLPRGSTSSKKLTAGISKNTRMAGGQPLALCQTKSSLRMRSNRQLPGAANTAGSSARTQVTHGRGDTDSCPFTRKKKLADSGQAQHLSRDSAISSMTTKEVNRQEKAP